MKRSIAGLDVFELAIVLQWARVRFLMPQDVLTRRFAQMESQGFGDGREVAVRKPQSERSEKDAARNLRILKVALEQSRSVFELLREA
jgi:hypothetical protein